MIETMHDAPGIGLAAIQVADRSASRWSTSPRRTRTSRPQVFINPEILWRSDEPNTYEEGCLSIPEYYADVERPASVRVRALDRDGKEREVLADGLLATVLQHEIDHLDGMLFIDHISKLKRDRVIKKFQKAAKRRARARTCCEAESYLTPAAVSAQDLPQEQFRALVLRMGEERPRRIDLDDLAADP